MSGGGTVLRAAFVLERHLGHQTFADTLRRTADRDGDVAPTWIHVDYAESHAWWERLPLGDQVRGTVRGRAEVRRGLRHVDRQVTFFNTQVPAVIGGRAARTGPFVLCTDVTPAQYDSMARAYGHTPDTGGAVARAKHALTRRAFQAAAHSIAWSTWVRDSLIADYGVRPDRVTVIPPGVDTTRWTVGERAAGGPLRILFVGGDLHRKGGATVLEAFAALPQGSAELTLVTRSRDPGHAGVRVVRGLTPNTPELVALYRSSDVFVLPSEAEAFGIAAVEAAATGLPVIASRVGGLTDIVVDGETGYLIDPADAERLARHLRALSDDGLRLRLGAAARRHALARFDAERNVRDVLRILHGAAAHGRAHARSTL